MDDRPRSPAVVFALARTIVYASLFIGLFLVFVPARVLARSGVVGPPPGGPWRLIGTGVAAAGLALALWCVVTFAVVGRGTPAPFDPPRRLVVRGPYRYLRNPMYLGAALALGGAAVAYRSLALLAYTALFLAITHVFVLVYEEPTLRRTFGDDYERYCRDVRRWWPRLRG